MQFSLWNSIINLLFPPSCIRCDKEGRWLCASCEAALPLALIRWCPFCGSAEDTSHLQSHALPFDALYTFLRYQEPWVASTVRSLKYDGVVGMATTLSALLAQRLPESVGGGTEILVTAIPMHRSRERKRGFNQAEALGRRLAEQRGWTFAMPLRRIRKVHAQAGTGATERVANMAGVFGVDSGAQGMVRGRNVLLVDDVVTTGATLSEAARTLRDAGANCVVCVTVAYSDIQKEFNAVSKLSP